MVCDLWLCFHCIQIFHKRLTFLIGPEAQEIFFKASDDVLSQNEVYDFMRPVFGPGIVYDANKKNRQVQFQALATGLRAPRLKVRLCFLCIELSPLFLLFLTLRFATQNTRFFQIFGWIPRTTCLLPLSTHSYLKAYVAKIEDETRKYLKEYWSGASGEIDLLMALGELTILTASRCLHGDDVRENLFKEVQSLYHDLDHGLTPLTVFWPNAPTEAHRKRNAAREEMVRLFGSVIKERRLHPEKSKSDGTDILSIFQDIKYKDGTPITDAEVTGLLIALLFAGQHTSCISSTWTLLFIANDPSIFSRVLEEQDRVLGNDRSQTLSYDHVQEMEFLHNCMREALRLCPTFIMILRRAEVDIPVRVQDRQYVIPKGDFVCISPTVSMRLKTTFPDPDTFDPDRFAEPREEHKTPYAYLGFGGGMHSCMGQNFAFVQVKTILSVILREYHVERLAPTMPAIGYDDMVVGPKGDCRIRYTRRAKTS